MLGLIGGPQQSLPCPTSGCPPPVPSVLPWYWWIPGAAFFSGIALVIAGIVLIIIARGVKPRQETAAASAYA